MGRFIFENDLIASCSLLRSYLWGHTASHYTSSSLVHPCNYPLTSPLTSLSTYSFIINCSCALIDYNQVHWHLDSTYRFTTQQIQHIRASPWEGQVTNDDYHVQLVTSSWALDLMGWRWAVWLLYLPSSRWWRSWSFYLRVNNMGWNNLLGWVGKVTNSLLMCSDA